MLVVVFYISHVERHILGFICLQLVEDGISPRGRPPRSELVCIMVRFMAVAVAIAQGTDWGDDERFARSISMFAKRAGKPGSFVVWLQPDRHLCNALRP